MKSINVLETSVLPSLINTNSLEEMHCFKVLTRIKKSFPNFGFEIQLLGDAHRYLCECEQISNKILCTSTTYCENSKNAQQNCEKACEVLTKRFHPIVLGNFFVCWNQTEVFLIILDLYNDFGIYHSVTRKDLVQGKEKFETGVNMASIAKEWAFAKFFFDA